MHIIEHHLQYITNIPGHVLYIDVEAVMVKVGAGQMTGSVLRIIISNH